MLNCPRFKSESMSKRYSILPSQYGERKKAKLDVTVSDHNFPLSQNCLNQGEVPILPNFILKKLHTYKYISIHSVVIDNLINSYTSHITIVFLYVVP